MSISMLRELAEKKLPFTVTGGDNVDAVHILLIGGHIEAVVAEPVRTPTGWINPSARVEQITRSGWRMLRLFPSRPESPRRLLDEVND